MTPSENQIRRSGSTGFITTTRRKSSQRLISSGCRNCCRAGSVLDYGCGSGYLAARLAKGGYEVFTTDVLDYRYAEARHLPFVQMTSSTDISYPDDSVDVAVVLAVLHHINPNDLPRVIQRLRKIARYALIKEDTYGLPEQIEGLAESLATQPLLRSFVAMTLERAATSAGTDRFFRQRDCPGTSGNEYAF